MHSLLLLVEGISDKIAVETLAEQRGVYLDEGRVAVVAIGGAQAIGRVLERARTDTNLRVGGLCDAGEEHEFRLALERAGLGANLTRSQMEGLGFYVCVEDLEDELIRALGPQRVEQIVDEQGELRSFRTLQKQPAWRGRPREEQLHRFMGSGGRRKTRYARLLVQALDPHQVPRPLDRVVARVADEAA